MRKFTVIATLAAASAFLAAQPPPPPQPAPPQTPAAQPPASLPMGAVNLNGVSLSDVVDQLARYLHLNLMVDQKLTGTVTLNTYGDPKNIDARSLLDQILRVNGFGMTQVGDLYRIVPLTDMPKQPLRPQELTNTNIPDDDQTILNLVFLKYMAVDELMKVLDTFTGEHAILRSYAPANLLFILDSRRNMRRTMELIALFDSDTFANQRVHMFDVKNTRPSDIVKDLENVLKAISLDNKSTTVKFLPIDRINTLIAVAPNPGVFDTIQSWLAKLDVPVKVSAGGAMETHVYRVRYRESYCLAMALSQLYGIGSNPGSGTGYPTPVPYGGGTPYGGYSPYGGYGGYGGYSGYGGASPYGGYGGIGNSYGNPGGYGNMNGFSPGFGGAGSCGGGAPGAFGGGGYGAYPGGGSYGAPAFGGYSAQVPANVNGATGQPLGTVAPGTAAAAAAAASAADQPKPPRIVPNPLDNALIIQADAQQYQNILSILKELDTPPRQILLEAKIMEVDLTDQFSSGVSYLLQPRSGDRKLGLGLDTSGIGTLTAGALVSNGRELLAALSLNENAQHVHMISEPSLIATDSIPASINVGTQVPVSTGTTVIPSGGNTVTSSSISSENTGVTLQVNARVSPSGIVTLYIGQQISGINNSVQTVANTPAFDQQVVQTQITLQDGDTVAIGGTIKDTVTDQVNGIPGLVRIPWLGALFGSKVRNHQRSELIMFMTPHVIWNEDNLIEASDELKARVKLLKKMVKDL